MSFKRNSLDDDDNGFDNDQPFHKRQRFDDGGRGGRNGRGRGRGRGDGGFRGNRGFRGRGGFNKFNNDDDDNGGFQDRRGRGGFRGGDRGGFRGGRGRGRGGYGFDDRGRGRGRGGFRGGDRGGFRDNRGDRPNFSNESIIKVNQVAPDFNNILNQNSENVSLQQFRGKYVVLFIYYRDNTFGCSTEQKAFRDLKSEFDKQNAVILGVSRDDTDSHKAAAEEGNLNFSLLADTDGRINRSYGALDDRDRVNRCTFIISPEGKVAAVWARVFGFEKHAQDVLNKLQELSNGGGSDDNNEATKGDNDNDVEEDDDDNDDDNENDDQEANNEANNDDDEDEE